QETLRNPALYSARFCDCRIVAGAPAAQGAVPPISRTVDAWRYLMASPAHAAPSLPAIVVLVRHADKTSDDEDAPLSLAGSQRAQDLMRSLAHVKLSAIVTTQFIRSKDTAKPVAAAQ